MSYTENKHKRGDTFEVSGQVSVALDDGQINDFTGWAGKCQIRDGAGNLIAELGFEWLDQVQGIVRIFSTASTQDWPIGPVRTDVQLTAPDGVVVSTDTQVIEIVEDITR